MKAGAFRCRSRRRRPVMALNQHAGRRRIRRDHVPGHALIDHAVTIPMALMWPSAACSDQPWPVRIVPVEINTVQHPLPSMARCLKLGRAIGRALETYPRDLRVAVVGTGGLSHQLDGTRAGFVNKEFDALCLNKIVAEPEALARYSIHELVELSASQGVEFLNWMAMRGALTGCVSELRTIERIVAWRDLDHALPHRAIVELNGHAVGRIERPRSRLPPRCDPGSRSSHAMERRLRSPGSVANRPASNRRTPAERRGTALRTGIDQ